MDLEGCIIRGNVDFARLLSLPPEKVLGMHFKDFTHPYDIEAGLTPVRQVLQGRQDGYAIEKRYVAGFGRWTS